MRQVRESVIISSSFADLIAVMLVTLNSKSNYFIVIVVNGQNTTLTF